jgi:hypothetical protein
LRRERVEEAPETIGTAVCRDDDRDVGHHCSCSPGRGAPVRDMLVP